MKRGVVNQVGGGLYAGWPTGELAPGTPEGVPRTAHHKTRRHKKTAGAVCALTSTRAAKPDRWIYSGIKR